MNQEKLKPTDEQVEAASILANRVYGNPYSSTERIIIEFLAARDSRVRAEAFERVRDDALKICSYCAGRERFGCACGQVARWAGELAAALRADGGKRP